MSPKPIRAKDARTITIEIDHRSVDCPEGVTVLRAAELNGIDIPSLCSHKDLSPFGGCRLCIVEIEGMRGYPLACSTVVHEGMKLLTETTALRDMRREILELILSEHPSSCLICGEQAECKQSQYTIRKAGVTTGCRYCPNDGQCDLQALVERLGVTEIHNPILYRGYEAEHDDPFFDRDYNLCILCGRCVRMCQEVRGTAVLAFKYRGPRTQVGPAFGRNHIQAGCEFCGACVTVCPTGALADKVSKWDGKPDGSRVSTCPFCALGCRIDLHHRGGRLSRVEAHLDPEINDGQLCVRGRFCLPETTHHHERARKPAVRRGRYFREVNWPEALDDVSARLTHLDTSDLLMLVSPDLTNESLYAARKFVRSCTRSGSIDSTARFAFPGGVGLWSRLFSLPISLKAIADADSIIAIGLDSRFSFSVAGVQVRKALREGATLVTIDPRDSNLARYTQHWLRPKPGREGDVFRALARRLLVGPGKKIAPSAIAGTGVDAQSIAKAADVLAAGRDLAVIVGPTAFALDTDLAIGETMLELGERDRTSFLPLYPGTNARGALELGILGPPPPESGADAEHSVSLDDLMQGRARPKVLYLVGETPFRERPDCDYIIAQDLYPPPFEVDVFLPAASFAEAEGTLTNIEGRVQEVVRIEELSDGAITGVTRPDWQIFAALAERLGCPACAYGSADAILKEIAEQIPSFPARPDRRPRRLGWSHDLPFAKSRTPRQARGWQLVIEPGGLRHRGIDLSAVVEGLSELGLEEGFRVHPDDLAALGLASGDEMLLANDGIEVSGSIRADADCPRGTVYVCRPFAWGGISDRRTMEPLYRLDGNLRAVTVAPSRKGRSGPPAQTEALDRKETDNV